MMITTVSDRYSLLWLENAMTLPIDYLDQHYYLDVRTNNLFALIDIEENNCMTYVDRFYQELDVVTANELAQRLASMDHQITQVFEIPRLTVNEKIRLQLRFLAELPRGYPNSTLITAVKLQPNDSSFVLDFILGDTHSVLLAKHWDEYKLETISSYINQFTEQLNNRLRLAVA